MYANLRVKVGGGDVLYAHEVRIENGELVVCEDLNDGGSHAEPGAVHRHVIVDMAAPVRITADF